METILEEIRALREDIDAGFNLMAAVAGAMFPHLPPEARTVLTAHLEAAMNRQDRSSGLADLILHSGERRDG